MKIGIIREEKIPPDSRVPLTPSQIAQLNLEDDLEIVVQQSEGRCYSDEEYRNHGVDVVEDVNNCDVLLGVKEVPVNNLIPDKTYFFFSHTIKKQSYNRKLLQALVEKTIRMIDYEVLTDDRGARVIAFGKFAGMVGAHNALWTWGQRTGSPVLPRMNTFKEYDDAMLYYQQLKIPPVRIVLTGTGRVANGSAQVLKDMGIRKVSPMHYLTTQYDHPVFTQLNSFFYAERKDGMSTDMASDYYHHPTDYKRAFYPFVPLTDILINGIYWDNDAPVFFTREEMKRSDFNIKVISDVTCDIAPVSSIPSTLKATTITDPIFGYDVMTGEETKPHGQGVVDMMTIDNLPNELPRDASKAFGEMFIKYIIQELKSNNSKMLHRATITKDGDLGIKFEYLREYLEGKD